MTLAACAPAGQSTTGSAPAAAENTTPGAPVPDDQQVFRQATDAEPASQDFNKDLYSGGFRSLFSGLTILDKDFLPQPHVAEKWEISDDGTVYTLHFKEGQKWTNGDPVTAHDFEWSFKRQLDPATQASYAAFLYDLKNAEAFNTKKEGITADDVGAKALDDLTLELTLEGPRGYFLTVLAYTAALPAHRGAVEKIWRQVDGTRQYCHQWPLEIDDVGSSKAIDLRTQRRLSLGRQAQVTQNHLAHHRYHRAVGLL